MSRVGDVIRAALVVPLPCPMCTTTEDCLCVRPPGHSVIEDRAALIEQSLQTYGLLAPVEVVEQDPEDMAQWLADLSQFPRYTAPDGWQRILQSEADVELAVAQAKTRCTQPEAVRLMNVRVALLRHVHDHPRWV